MSIQNVPVQNLPFLYINGLMISNEAIAVDTVINLSAGQCRDSNDVMDINLLNPVTIDTDVVGNINGLDQGVLLANRVYAIYVIGDSTNKRQAAGLISLASNEVPLMPFGYDSYRLVGYVPTNGAVQFQEFYLSGNNNYRKFRLDVPRATAVTAGNSTVYTPVNLSSIVPPVDNIPVIIAFLFTPGAASRVLNLTPGNAIGNAVTITGQVSAVPVTGNAEVLANLVLGVPEVDYKVTNAGDTVAINVAGFDFFV